MSKIEDKYAKEPNPLSDQELEKASGGGIEIGLYSCLVCSFSTFNENEAVAHRNASGHPFTYS